MSKRQGSPSQLHSSSKRRIQYTGDHLKVTFPVQNPTDVVCDLGTVTTSTQTTNNLLHNASAQTDGKVFMDRTMQTEDFPQTLDFTCYHPSFRANLFDFVTRITSPHPHPLLRPQPSPSMSNSGTADVPTSFTDSSCDDGSETVGVKAEPGEDPSTSPSSSESNESVPPPLLPYPYVRTETAENTYQIVNVAGTFVVHPTDYPVSQNTLASTNDVNDTHARLSPALSPFRDIVFEELLRFFPGEPDETVRTTDLQQ